jgi:hypothetical protein
VIVHHIRDYQNTTNMISYDQVMKVMDNPPTEALIEMYNSISEIIMNHTDCINEKNPFRKLSRPGTFCISATSIQSKYIAFVLGKNVDNEFPTEVINYFFNIDNNFQVQYGKIQGNQIDGCICLIHQEAKEYDLQEVYNFIYQ